MQDTIITLEDVNFTYEEKKEKALTNISFSVKEGEFILLAGPSSSGKTTIFKCINGLIPNFQEGVLTGTIKSDGKNTANLMLHDIGETVGCVFQDPRSQFFTTRVYDEIAFGCQNMGLSINVIKDRIDQTFKELGIQHLRDKGIFQLSSGEKQKVAIASCYAMQPKVLLFDEPSANLDIASTYQLQKLMKKLKQSGYTIIVVEHRLYYLRELADRILFISEGKIAHETTKKDIPSITPSMLSALGLRQFDLSKVTLHSETFPQNKNISLYAKNLSFSYKESKRAQGSTSQKILSDISFSAYGGQVIGLVGENGAGKTTLSKILAGLLPESDGEVYINGSLTTPKDRCQNTFLVMQDSDYQLFEDSVIKEMKLGLRDSPQLEKKCEEILKTLNLYEFKDCHPATLSRGQKQRLTIAISFIQDADIIFFDEPTSGLDGDNMKRVTDLIHKLAKNNKLILVITHDYEFLLSACTRILHLNQHKLKDDFQLTKDTVPKLYDILFPRR